MLHKRFSSKEDLKKCFGKNVQFERGGGLVWCEPDDHPFFQSEVKNKFCDVYSVLLFTLFFNSLYIVRHEIESILCPNQQRRPLHLLL